MSHTDTLAIVETHQPWCRDHHVLSEESNDIGWCRNTVLLEHASEYDYKSPETMRVGIQPRVCDESDPAIVIDLAELDDKVTPVQARRLAAALTEAADLLERVAR